MADDDKQDAAEKNDEPIKIDLAPEIALKALLEVDPDSKPAPKRPPRRPRGA